MDNHNTSPQRGRIFDFLIGFIVLVALGTYAVITTTDQEIEASGWRASNNFSSSQ